MTTADDEPAAEIQECLSRKATQLPDIQYHQPLRLEQWLAKHAKRKNSGYRMRRETV